MSCLLTEFNNGKIQLHNRLVMPPMATANADEQGRMNRDIFQFNRKQSKRL